MSTMKFILRRSTRGEAYEGSMSLRIIHDRKVKVVTTKIRLYPHEWDQQRQEIILPLKQDERYHYLCKTNQTLNEYRQEFKEAIEHLEKTGRYKLLDIVSQYRSLHNVSTLLGYIERQTRQLRDHQRDRTARAYRTAGRALVLFNKGKDILLKDINACLIQEFEMDLKNCGKAMNTVSYYMRMLRAIYRKAVAERVIEAKRDNPFAGVFTGVEQTSKRALDSDKLKTLQNLDFSSLLEHKASEVKTVGNKQTILNPSKSTYHDKSLYDSWRYFFFCFHARGMSFVDMAYLRKENIRQGVISYYRKKTKKKIEVTISPTLQRLIDSFSEEVKHTPYLFPIIRDVNKPTRIQYESGLHLQNKRLKRLAKMAGITDRLSTHVTRHSWATMGKKQNLPLWVISEGLGHATEKMTYTYLASFDRSTIDRASRRISQAVINPKTTKSGRFASVR